MAVLSHKDMCTGQQVLWNMEGSLEIVVASLCWTQTGHVVFEACKEGVLVNGLGAWRKEFSRKPKSLAIDHLRCRATNVLFECGSDAEKH